MCRVLTAAPVCRRQVRVTCGAETVLLSAREPTTCAYLLEMKSPAACTPLFARESGLDL